MTEAKACMHALEKQMATHSSILAWRIPGMEELGGLPSTGLNRVRHDWIDLASAAAATISWINTQWQGAKSWGKCKIRSRSRSCQLFSPQNLTSIWGVSMPPHYSYGFCRLYFLIYSWKVVLFSFYRWDKQAAEDNAKIAVFNLLI